MIPSIVSRQLRKGLEDYIDTTFPITNQVFKGMIKELLGRPQKIFQEPYVSVKLPFRTNEDNVNVFDSIEQKYSAYVHQEKAYRRLIGERPSSTLIATGTGSGKTECFMYPILEYCYKHRGEAGIKAIIIYPMNALASDQAKRIARLINDNSKLNGNITAGMFVGEQEEFPCRLMNKDSVITDRDVIRNTPPDILLTNYKMLDYLMIRPSDAILWNNNKNDTLKFIVVDELHTFDGAQGTDLACLIRRLKARLGTTADYLCSIGTSATMGSKDNALDLMRYANQIFDEKFDDDSIVTEDRLTAREYFDDVVGMYYEIPQYEDMVNLKELADSEVEESSYIKEAYYAWFSESVDSEIVQSAEWRVQLGNELKKIAFFRDMIAEMQNEVVPFDKLLDLLGTRYPSIKKQREDFGYIVIESLIALVSYAKSSKEGAPFLQVNFQFWFRELRRMVAKVTDENPYFEMSDDLNDGQKQEYLPVINCRECGATGWTALLSENNRLLVKDLSKFYSAFFSTDKKVVMAFPYLNNEITTDEHLKVRICKSCYHVNADISKISCQHCGENDLLNAYLPDLQKARNQSGKTKGYTCPMCGSGAGLSLVGAQSATLLSAGLSEIFASKFNNDKKLLAFSDSVQDASHRAGFFNARTWRSVMRSSIQQFLKTNSDELTLDAFAKTMPEYWLEELGNNQFISTFIPPNMTWFDTYEKLVNNMKVSSEEIASLIYLIKKRVTLEIHYEYGFNARTGRTLEKSGASTLSYKLDDLDNITDDLHELIINEIGEVRDIEKINVQHLLLGFLLRMKNNGAINKDTFEKFLIEDGNTYILSNKHNKWMPGLVGGKKAPKFLASTKSLGTGKNVFDIITNKSWYYEWCLKSVFIPQNIGLMREELPLEIYNCLIRILKKYSVLTEYKTQKKNIVWGLNSEKIFVTSNVMQVACEECGHTISMPEQFTVYLKGYPCHNDYCNGQYEIKSKEQNFYGRLYSNGDIQRIFAKEHTGLLKRDEREQVEKEFKEQGDNRKPWFPNVLSATPTLEMGIDIGDLSTVLLCSVPPGQAQYLQRIGRAGRRDGNAITAVVANAKSHDLYFYEDPLEMITGDMKSPAVFLDAAAVLERQFTAFCFDNWVKSGISPTAISKNLGSVFTGVISNNKDRFPNNFLLFVELNLSKIYNGYIEIMKENLSDDSKEHLYNFAFGDREKQGTLQEKIFFAINSAIAQRESLKKEGKRLNDKVKKAEGGTQDSSMENDYINLKMERSAIRKLIVDINHKNVFNFLSDEGLLPNYSFPEAGIILKAVIYRKLEKVNDNGKLYEHYIYEYNRPAASALSEFAPDSSFYAGGRKIKIDQVDMNMTKPELWRLCPSCNHSQLEIVDSKVNSCPKCGDGRWSDTGQVRKMLRLKMVYANASYESSKSGDESDERDKNFFVKQMLVNVESETDIEKAFRIDDENHPFGFEYLKKVNLREINFGEVDTVGEKTFVAGREDIRKGFKICKHCGKVQKSKSPEHSYSCNARNKDNLDNFIECLYLYRDFTSEAIRILIPSTSFEGSETRLQSFIAAVMLGLKKYFGSVEHIKATISEEPIRDTNLRKNYLVLYDSVPGGTGYLKQLMKSESNIIAVLEKALTSMKSCSCVLKAEKDGCYKCLFAYKQSRYIGSISRDIAIELLDSIMSNKDKLVPIKSIDDIVVNSLFESELERRFIEAFKRVKSEKLPVEIKSQRVNQKKCYFLKIGDSTWNIEPQVELSHSDGVRVTTRADFVIWPIRNNYKGVLPIAIYTDGYAYHKEQIGQDFSKRMAVVNSGNYYVWSLSWKDVESVFKDQGEYTQSYNDYRLMNYPTIVEGLANTNAELNGFKPYIKNSFDNLLELLENPSIIGLYKEYAYGLSMSVCEPKEMHNDEYFERWNDCLDRISDIDIFDKQQYKKGESIVGIWNDSSPSNITYYSATLLDSLQKLNKESLFIAIIEDRVEVRTNSYESAWNGYIAAYNLMQFHKKCFFLSSTGIDESIYDWIWLIEEDISVKSADTKEKDFSDWDEVFKLILYEDVLKIAQRLMEDGIETPNIIGYDLLENDEIIAGAELSWEDKKIVILSEEESADRNIFETRGWTVIESNMNYEKDIIKVFEEV